MFYSVLQIASQRARHILFIPFLQWCLRIFFSCCETGLFGLSLVFWFLFARTLDQEVLIFTFGVHCVEGVGGGGGGGGGDNHVPKTWLLVWSLCLEQGGLKKRSIFRHDPDMPCWQRFQTCRTTENVSFCSGLW